MRRARPLLGTYVSVMVDGVDAATAVRASDDAFAAISRVERLMSFHHPHSDLSRLNREAGERAVEVDAWTALVLRTACRLRRDSGGRFDVAVVSALQRQGLLPGVPAVDAGEAAHAAHSTAAFADGTDSAPTIAFLPGHRLRFLRPGLQLDLGGIAKGFALDRACAVLRRHRVPTAVVEAGGDVAVIGDHTIAIRDPRCPGRELRRLRLRDQAVATSAHYFIGERAPAAVAAIIDPQRGEACADYASVTVRARSGMLADALTKVVMLDGERAAPLLERHGAEALVVTHDGRQFASAALHQEAVDAA